MNLIPLHREPFPKNMVQAPRSATHHPRSVVQILTNSDRLSPIAARAPAVSFMTDRGPRALDQGSGKVAGKVWIVDREARSAKLLI
ncbi:hypothetical protein N9D70_02450 [bacterium]|nr:hypothetical protein [bacterium]